MAARHLQKLRGQDVQDVLADAQYVDASESEEETAALNPFDLLDDNEVGNVPQAYSALGNAAHKHMFVFRRMTAVWTIPPLQKMVLQHCN